MTSDIHVEGRQHRRHRALACRCLPEWAVPVFATVFCDALIPVVRIRRALREEGATLNNDGRDKRLKAAEQRYLQRLERIVRLCTYKNIDMEEMWRSLPSLQSGHVVVVMIDAINEIVEKFETLPKRTASARKKSLLSAAHATENLLSRIEKDPELFDLASDALGLYLWTRSGTTKPVSSVVSSAVVEHTMFQDLLKFFRARIDDLMVEKTLIAHPGRGDEGLQPYLIRELSKLMHMYFLKPMDNTVAILVSAILDLPVALDRDNIRPYTKKRGRI